MWRRVDFFQITGTVFSQIWRGGRLGCIPGVEGTRNGCKKMSLALHPQGMNQNKVVPSSPPPHHHHSRHPPPPPLPPSLLHQDSRVPPQSTTNGAGTWPDQPIERRQRHRAGPAPEGPQAAGHSRGGALRCFCCPPSSAELSRLPPAVAEPSRTQPNSAEPSRTPRRSSRRRPSAAERAS